LIAGSELRLLAWAPAELTETRSMAPVWRSLTKMSQELPFVSLATKFEAWERNVTYRPFALNAGSSDWALPSAPAAVVDTRVVVRVGRDGCVDVGHVFDRAVREVRIACRSGRPILERDQMVGLVECVCDRGRVRVDELRSVALEVVAIADRLGAWANDRGQAV